MKKLIKRKDPRLGDWFQVTVNDYPVAGYGVVPWHEGGYAVCRPGEKMRMVFKKLTDAKRFIINT